MCFTIVSFQVSFTYDFTASSCVLKWIGILLCYLKITRPKDYEFLAFYMMVGGP